MGLSLNADRYAIQNEVVPFILARVLEMLKADKTSELIQYMDDLKVTNEMVKEHMLSICFNKTAQQMFDAIDTRTKTSFTKEYNKQHCEIKRVAGGAKGKKGMDEEFKSKMADEDKASDDDSDDGAGGMMDEDEMAEIKKAKALENKQKK